MPLPSDLNYFQLLSHMAEEHRALNGFTSSSINTSFVIGSRYDILPILWEGDRFSYYGLRKRSLQGLSILDLKFISWLDPSHSLASVRLILPEIWAIHALLMDNASFNLLCRGRIAF